MHTYTLRGLWLAAGFCIGLSPLLAHADDTDIYLDPQVPSGAEPLVMFTLDYRPNLGSTVCGGNECDQLVAEGYLPAAASYTFFDVLRAVMKRVLDPLDGVKIGFMMNHANSCSGGTTAGPTVSGCSNGGYVLHGYTAMSEGTDDGSTYQVAGEDPGKIALFDKLDGLPTPQGNLSHKFQGKELYFEQFRYLTGQGIYNGHLGYQDFGDNDSSTNLDVHTPAAVWDTSIENGADYVSPLAAGGQCTRMFNINLMFQVSQQEDDSDAAITQSTAAGGMGGINLSGTNDSFDTVIRYMRDADLGDGNFGSVGDLEGTQNLISYFLVDPSKINQTTSGYAEAGGTGVPLPLSEDPEELTTTLENIFKSILSVSATFVSPSVPVNVFNRAQTVNEVYLALFDADEDGFPRWEGNLKKLRIGENTTTGDAELQDVTGLNAIDVDGRIKREALTFWTDASVLPPPEDDEVPGKDGRSVPRGGAGQNVPGFLSGSPGEFNADVGARQLYAEDASALNGLMNLDADATTAAALWSELTAEWSPAPSSATYSGASPSEQDRAVNILRHARGLLDDGTTVREWLLADPLHSRPLPINYGARAGYDADNPDIRVFMGSNDGFLRMFRNTDTGALQDGGERWAFMPRAVVPKLDRLRLNTASSTPVHPITVDGSPVAYTLDNNLDGALKSADGDKVYVYFGLRRGGKSYYALDVSDPDSPQLMWSIAKGGAGSDFAELAQSWSTPTVGHLEVNGTVLPVLVFAGGYNGDDDGDDLGDLGKDAKNRATRAGTTPSPGTDDDEGNAIFIVNAEDGSLIWKAAKGASTGYDSAAKAYRHPEMHDSFAADLAAVDTDGDGLLDRVYAADTGGVVWRVDLAGLADHDSDATTPMILVNDDPSVWTAMRLFSAGRHWSGFSGLADDRRFFNRPDVVQSRDDLGPFDGVILGSGDREDPLGDEVEHWFYMVKDRAITSGLPPTSTLEHADLADLTDNCLQDGSCGTAPDLVNGWRIRLEALGEKNLANAVTAGGTVFFTTFEPTPPSGTCSLSEGTGRLYAIDLQDATAVFNFDTTNDDVATGTETLERSDEMASGGIPVDVVPLGEGEVLVQGQEAGENIMTTGGRTSFKTYWHTLYE